MDSIDRCGEDGTRRAGAASSPTEPPPSTERSTKSGTGAVRTAGDRRHRLRTDGGQEEGATFEQQIDDDPVAVAVVEAVAAVSGEAVEALPPLGRTVDTEALEELFAPTVDGRRRQGTVTFVYAGYEVRVRNAKTVVIRGDV